MTYLLPAAHGAGDALKVRVRFISHAFDKARPVLCIEIDDDTGQRDITDSWDELKRLRRELAEASGPFGRDAASMFYLDCWLKHLDGHSWKEIAAEVNRIIKLMLADPELLPAYDAWCVLDWCLPGSRVKDLKDVGLQAIDVLDNVPVTEDDLKARVRAWREHYGIVSKK